MGFFIEKLARSYDAKRKQQLLNHQKTASEYIDEQFEKLASFGFGNIHQNFNSRKRKLHDIM